MTSATETRTAPEPRLDPSRSALVLIDLQNDVLRDDRGELFPWASPVIARAKEAAAWARRSGLALIWVRVARRDDMRDAYQPITDLSLSGRGRSGKRLVQGTPGAELAEGLTVEPGDYTVVKRRVNAFYGTPLEIYLRRIDVRTVLFGGAYTNMGVEATVRAAYDRDLDSIVVSDCCAAYSPEAHEYPLRAIFPRLARVRTLAEIQALAAKPNLAVESKERIDGRR